MLLGSFVRDDRSDIFTSLGFDGFHDRQIGACSDGDVFGVHATREHRRDGHFRVSVDFGHSGASGSGIQCLGS